MGYGFVDVFNAIGGLVSDVFYKADPKKSDVKNYFESIAKILQDTQAKLDALSKEQGVGDKGTQVVDTSKKASGWIKEMHKAVEDTAKAGTGGNESIANVAAGGDDNGNGKKADKGSVTGIAKGMKAIVDAAKKAGVELKAADVDGGGAANDAGKLFASGGNAHAGGDADAEGAAEKAGEAVSAVSGDQILKAIVDAAGSTAGKGASQATNAVEAAIGANGAAEGAAFGDNMQKKNQIAAAIVLRGLAKDGKFANTNDAENGKVVAAVKSAVAQGAAEKAGEAVSAVSGDQILKAIVDAAESTEGKGAGQATNAVEAAIGDAGAGVAFGNNNMKKNQIAAAIVLRGLAKDGKFANANDAENGAKVVAAVKSGEWIKEMNKAVEDTAKAGTGSSDLIANVAGGGGGNDAGRLFANGNAGNANEAQGAAEKAGEAVSAVSGDQILKAIVDAAESTTGKGANEAKNAVEAAIGDDGDGAGNGAEADVGSVTGIAKGMKAIVDAAKKAGVELKADDVAVANGDNNAGRLFASGAAGNNAGVAAEAQGAAAKAGEAVSAASGDQILKAIVDAAGSTTGKGADTAKNAVEAAIGADGADAAAFAAMQKKNQIAAAIVLRGLAKGGKFANANDGENGAKVKAAKKASGWIKEMHKAVEDTAKAGTGGSDLIANVAVGGAGDNGNGKKADVGSVTGIAKGMKAIVDAAKKAGVEFKSDDVDGGAANDAGRLFANGGNAGVANEGAAEKAGEAVSAVSGDQILKAIVDAAGTTAGKGAGDATNAVEAAIGANGAAVVDADAQGAAEKAGEAVSAVSGDQILKAIVDAAESTAGKGAGDATNAVEAAIGADGGNAAAFAAANMKKNQIAAAIVLRGLAKDGKFANTNAGENGAKVVAAVKSAVDG
ncbi:variable large family protein [Borreliella burgdorferi]|uniref:variable large family protein n=1 Tax=Borreliella burgdorferi TaxID=139 RepID=UPI0020CF2481|nr:variable large family protein [Borreliella burgdorferi]